MLFAGLLTIPRCTQRSGQNSCLSRQQGRVVSSHTGSARHRRRRVSVRQRRRRGRRASLGVQGERFASLARAEWTCRPLAVSPLEQHLLAKSIGGRARRAGDGGGSWAEGEGRRVAETLKLREASSILLFFKLFIHVL